VLIHLQRLPEGRAAGCKRRDVQIARLHQLQAGFEVALLGPADVADRVVRAGPFIGRVVAARSVTAREADVDFLAEGVFPGEIHLCLADDDHPAAVAQDFQCLLGRSVGGGGRGEDRGVDAKTFRPRPDFLAQVLLAGDDDFFSAHRQC